MFEKSFEEYKKLPKWKGKIFMKDEETCYKDGAEFGYNKAKEEIRKELLELRADSFDAGMFLRVGETLRNLGIKED